MPSLGFWKGDDRKGCGTYAWEGGDAFEELLMVSVDVQVLIAAGTRVEADFQDAVFGKSEFEIIEFCETADEKAGAEEQNHRESNLGDHEGAAEFAWAAAESA